MVTQSDAAYGRWMRGAGPSYWERQRVWVQCAECRKDMAIGSLAVYMHTQHGREAVGRRHWETTAPGGGGTYLQDGLPDHQGTAELPRRGVSGTGGNEKNDAGPFLPPACPGYRHHFGGGKPHPPTVPPMQHSGALVHTEQEAPCHCPVCQESGEEA